MELFVWVWAWDKRLLCGLSLNSKVFAYIWLMPILVAAITLTLTWVQRFTADQSSLSDCLRADEEAKHNARELERVMSIQEGILISILFAAMLTLIVADRIASRTKQHSAPAIPQQQLVFSKKTGEVISQPVQSKTTQLKNHTTAYDFRLRHKSVRSVPARVLLFLALVNYAFSYAFKRDYEAYLNTPIVAQSTANECTVPGAAVLATYSIFLVMGTGTFVVAVFTLAGIYKITHILLLLCCPVPISRCKKRMKREPTDFAHYLGEFDFAIDEEPQVVHEVPPLRLSGGKSNSDAMRVGEMYEASDVSSMDLERGEVRGLVPMTAFKSEEVNLKPGSHQTKSDTFKLASEKSTDSRPGSSEDLVQDDDNASLCLN